MKKILFLGIGSALVFTMSGVGTASADNGPHMKTSKAAGTAGVVIANAGASKCASCHRAHTAKAEFLLKQAQANASQNFRNESDLRSRRWSGVVAVRQLGQVVRHDRRDRLANLYLARDGCLLLEDVGLRLRPASGAVDPVRDR